MLWWQKSRNTENTAITFQKTRMRMALVPETEKVPRLEYKTEGVERVESLKGKKEEQDEEGG